jgi:Kef-type K+ transport system membrane component KefB/predicted amino acid-binding ACT domain protein
VKTDFVYFLGNSAATSSDGGLDISRVLLDLAIILLVAKVAAEVSDRLAIPAVIGEILAGILIGNSVLGLVNANEILYVMSELGVIFLLLQVGLETDVVELKNVGRASLFVGVIGVVAPMVLGVGTGVLFGNEIMTSLFLGAALTATSIGITARVFGDLRALATVEARIVLGAAVADDILGLIILTVITRVVEQGSVGIGTIISTTALAVVFLVITSTIGLKIFPILFSRISKLSKSSSTIPVVAIGITLGFAVLADAAQLAPIIGAFVAGFSLRRITAHERVERDVSSLGQIFIPIFFLNIGINTDLSSMANSKVLGIAAALSAVAIFGKLISSVGAFGVRADKLAIGLGMLPRGEVGLIFATIGLRTGVLNKDLYGALLVVVLTTTLVAPPLLRWRLGKEQSAVDDLDLISQEPTNGWLSVSDGIISLNGTPPVSMLVELGLDTALLVSDARPNENMLDWFALHRNATLSWNKSATVGLLRVLRYGSARSWRFLDAIGLISRALPEVASAMSARSSDATELDPTHSLRFPTVDAICSNASTTTTDDDEIVLAAFAKDINDAGADWTQAVHRLGLDLATTSEINMLVEGSAMLHSITQVEPLQITDRLITQIANHLKNPKTVEQCRQLMNARDNINETQHFALIQIVTGVQEVLAHPDLIDSSFNNPFEVRMQAAQALVTDANIHARISNAPASYVLTHSAEELVRHAELVEPLPRSGQARVAVHRTANDEHEWMVNIATKDRSALLARLSGALASLELNVINADIATWPDGAVIDTFIVRSAQKPNLLALDGAVRDSLRGRIANVQRGALNLSVTIDQSAHPWHTILRIEGADRQGLLRDITAGLARSKVIIHHAKISTISAQVHNEFEVSDHLGRKISLQAGERVKRALR